MNKFEFVPRRDFGTIMIDPIDPVRTVNSKTHLYSLSFHSHVKAFGVPTELTPIALPLVDDAMSLLPAHISQFFANGAFEEALAPLAAKDAVVLA
jgi:hypothetical protein